MAISFKGAHFPQEIILMGIRWYLAYPLSTRHVEELMEERGVELDHATINRWVIKYSPQLEEAFQRRKRPVWTSWRMDETYIKVKGEWRYLYRAVDKHGKTIDFLLTEQRDEQAAKKFGLDHGVSHLLLFLYDAKAPHCRKNKAFKGLGHYAEWPKVADAVIK